MILSESALVESRSVRSATLDRVDVLGRVKALAMLPDGLHVTTEGVASYYEVGVGVVEKVVQRHRAELTENDLRVLRGDELREFKKATDRQGVRLSGRANAVTLFTRRTVLNVGQLLAESEIAKRVRTYLLDVEGRATPAQRLEAADRIAIARARLEVYAFASERRIVNPGYIESLARHELARMSGEEPDLEPLDTTLTCDDFLRDKGVVGSTVRSASPALGRRVASLYRAKHGRDPHRVQRPIDGVHRFVFLYTRRDADLFEAAWVQIRERYVGGVA